MALQEQSAQLAAQKAAQQALYKVIEAHPPVSKYRRETLVPVQSVVALFIVATAAQPLVNVFLTNVTGKEKKDNEKKNTVFLLIRF